VRSQARLRIRSWRSTGPACVGLRRVRTPFDCRHSRWRFPRRDRASKRPAPAAVTIGACVRSVNAGVLSARPSPQLSVKPRNMSFLPAGAAGRVISVTISSAEASECLPCPPEMSERRAAPAQQRSPVPLAAGISAARHLRRLGASGSCAGFSSAIRALAGRGRLDISTCRLGAIMRATAARNSGASQMQRSVQRLEMWS